MELHNLSKFVNVIFGQFLTYGLIYGGNSLFVASAEQAVIIDVNEYGATASAVTNMVIGQSGPPPIEIEMICNTPFVFILYQDTFDGGAQIIFIGVVNEP